jgi:hypothetical protein
MVLSSAPSQQSQIPSFTLDMGILISGCCGQVNVVGLLFPGSSIQEAMKEDEKKDQSSDRLNAFD